MIQEPGMEKYLTLDQVIAKLSRLRERLGHNAWVETEQGSLVVSVWYDADNKIVVIEGD